jgi:UDP-glucose 4-epimerase
MKETVLVTGGLGYLGGRISKFLAQNTDYQLRLGIYRQRSEVPDWLKNVSLVHLDLQCDDALDQICKGVKSIVHLAALNEIDSAQDPIKALSVNGGGTLKLLQAAERAGVLRFIYFSTAHVYGAPLVGNITEQTLPKPVHPYAITHRTAEDFVLAYHSQKKLTGVVLRLSNGFGAPVAPDVNRWTLLVNDLCRQAVTNGKLVLRSSGLQLRDFVTLEDVCRCVQHYLHLSPAMLEDGVFNVGGKCAMTVWEMAERIASRCKQTLGMSVSTERQEPRPGETSEKLDYCVDKLYKTGFKIIGNAEREIDSTLLFCRELYKR